MKFTLRADVAAAPPVDSSFSGAAKEKRDFCSTDVGAGALQAGSTDGGKEVSERRKAELWKRGQSPSFQSNLTKCSLAFQRSAELKN